MREVPGPVTINNTVKLKKPENRELLYVIKGMIKQPIHASVGWDMTRLNEVDYALNSTRLDMVRHTIKNLNIRLSAKPTEFDLKDTLLTFESRYFVLRSTQYGNNEKPSQTDDASRRNDQANTEHLQTRQVFQEGSGNTLRVDSENGSVMDNVNTLSVVLQVRQNSVLPIGELIDQLVFTFKGGSKCIIPVAFRSTGNIYGQSSVLPLGMLPNSGTVTKKYKIYFDKGLKPWDEVQWDSKGKLSNAVNILAIKASPEDNALEMLIEVDRRRIPLDAEGFVSAKITFSQGTKNSQEKVSLLLCGGI